MGLDLHITPGNSRFRCCYSTFNDLRERIAKHIGIESLRAQWQAGFHPSSDAAPELLPLLWHSDCDGDLSADQCGDIGPKLRDIALAWPDNRWRVLCLQLAACCSEAYLQNRPLVFS